jgi:hypothetical protein
MDREFVSDHTRFMAELLEKNPDWAKDQRAGRALWWDKSQDQDGRRRAQESSEPNKAYPYDVNFD